MSFLTKMLFKEVLIRAFWDQNVGPGWVKNGKKVFFKTSSLSANPVLPKNDCIYTHNSEGYFN